MRTMTLFSNTPLAVPVTVEPMPCKGSTVMLSSSSPAYLAVGLIHIQVPEVSLVLVALVACTVVPRSSSRLTPPSDTWNMPGEPGSLTVPWVQVLPPSVE